MAPALKLEVVAPGFFAIPPKKLRIESDANVNRTYFVSVKDGRIVAVGRDANPEERT